MALKSDERDYYLAVINIQQAMLEAHAQKNLNRFFLLQKELEKQQKSPFADFMTERAINKRETLKRLDNLLTEIKAVVKEL